jgi:hypothetical protein
MTEPSRRTTALPDRYRIERELGQRDTAAVQSALSFAYA